MEKFTWFVLHQHQQQRHLNFFGKIRVGDWGWGVLWRGVSRLEIIKQGLYIRNVLDDSLSLFGVIVLLWVCLQIIPRRTRDGNWLQIKIYPSSPRSENWKISPSNESPVEGEFGINSKYIWSRLGRDYGTTWDKSYRCERKRLHRISYDPLPSFPEGHAKSIVAHYIPSLRVDTVLYRHSFICIPVEQKLQQVAGIQCNQAIIVGGGGDHNFPFRCIVR